MPSHNFMLNGTLLETTKEYTYLGHVGVKFNKNGNLRHASDILTQKAQKAIFSMLRTLVLQ